VLISICTRDSRVLNTCTCHTSVLPVTLRGEASAEALLFAACFKGPPKPLRKAPAWLLRPVSAALGFGGKLVSVVQSPVPKEGVCLPRTFKAATVEIKQVDLASCFSTLLPYRDEFLPACKVCIKCSDPVFGRPGWQHSLAQQSLFPLDLCFHPRAHHAFRSIYGISLR
jgi:hypothetical protein